VVDPIKRVGAPHSDVGKNNVGKSCVCVAGQRKAGEGNATSVVSSMIPRPIKTRMTVTSVLFELEDGDGSFCGRFMLKIPWEDLFNYMQQKALCKT